MQHIERELKEFIISTFLFGQNDIQLRNDDSFLDRGIVDSTGVLELITFLETTYQIKIDDQEVIPANLDSIDNLLHFLERKRNGSD